MQQTLSTRNSQILCILTGCGGGDWPPLLALASGLHQRGHKLIVVCDRTTVEAVQAAGLSALCLPSALDPAHIIDPAISTLFSPGEKSFPEDENPLLEVGRSSANYIETSLHGWRPTLIITSLFTMGLGEMLSQEFAVPRCLLNPAFNFCHCREQRWVNDFSEMGAKMYRHWLLPLAETAHLILHATDPEFDFFSSSVPPQHKYVGPLFWELPKSIPEFLQEAGPPWILITLSTSPQPEDLTLVKIAIQALKKFAEKNVRVLVTGASGHCKDDLGSIPANVHVTGYVPHSQILPQCCLVISHAGHGIVMKALTHGIPMVLVPWGRDQPGVAARARRLGTAVVVSRQKYSEKTLLKAMKGVLENFDYSAQARFQSSRLRRMNPVAGAIRCIERFIENCPIVAYM